MMDKKIIELMRHFNEAGLSENLKGCIGCSVFPEFQTKSSFKKFDLVLETPIKIK